MASKMRIPIGPPPSEGQKDTRKFVKLTDPERIRKAIRHLESAKGAFFKDKDELNSITELRLRMPVFQSATNIVVVHQWARA